MSENAPQFSTIPGTDELSTLERDLRFHPSTTTHPKRLTLSQIEGFNREGYVAPVTMFDRDQADAHRRYFDRLLAEVIAAGGNSYSISTAHLKYGYVYDLLTAPAIVDCVADIFGENVIGWGSHFFCKMPGDGKTVAWHQDASYWPLTPSKTATVWLAIDSAHRDNACMRFVAGSHHFGHLTYRPSSEAEHNVLNQTVENAEQYGTVVYDELEAGQASIHSDLLLHGSDANASSRRRCGLTLRYCTPDVRAGADWQKKGVVVRGRDETGYWANPSRPNQD
jgi:non-heme Fe2+,alpha-ketoglutarate-dependent halogenase